MNGCRGPKAAKVAALRPAKWHLRRPLGLFEFATSAPLRPGGAQIRRRPEQRSPLAQVAHENRQHRRVAFALMPILPSRALSFFFIKPNKVKSRPTKWRRRRRRRSLLSKQSTSSCERIQSPSVATGRTARVSLARSRPACQLAQSAGQPASFPY